MGITIQERQQFLKQFRETWPIERLKSMKLQNYTSVGDNNSLIYWLEFGAGKYLGSIKGGDSSKFGIYERKAEPKGDRKNISMDERYSWKNKYGSNAKQAFSAIKQNILKVIKSIEAGDVAAIEAMDFESALKWKLAFIYQNHSKPSVLPIYALRKFEPFMAGKRNFTHSEAYTKLIADRNGKSALEYGFELWRKADVLEGKKNSDFDTAEIEDDKSDSNHSNHLNQIFFGPPGTGKTYITIEAAVKAADTGFIWECREQLKARYDELVTAGRIRFVTFHQSYSYEDFVEGLSATSTDGKISYEKKLGVFRKLVNAAREYRTTEVRKASDSFSDCWQAFIQQLDESPAGVSIKTKRSQFVITEVEDNTIRFDKNQGNSVHTLALSTLQAVFDGQREVHGGLQPYYDALITHIRELGQKLSATEVVRQNYVLVIDEINRGNISRIFGELITLIEPSKRIGAPEALEVTLPLTGDKFGVPDNLYIIGTMNTADRSLAGLDLALRRRFTFVEVQPQPELLDDVDVEGVNIDVMLRVMNQRITALLDRDHCIGHAYFMPLQDNPSLELLADIFAQNILPLLQEYFFEDWQRIGWVLADQTKPDSLAFIVKDKTIDAQQLFPGVSQFKPRDCWRINTAALQQAEAYQRIYQTAGPVTEQEA
ncbi:McrB family protein [Alishewanella tabrizica]|uniref:AAA+ ATPase domain-containing protein n=1 Tax=Alishewanella tabrizica TaxID=671278 RepID=A0ABQ2WET6_9ALTE|nr:AAA family ATPase [Alishewanella tabrizica]GGW49094.1 hypothetical protein GCM10008111_01020 [Alishewanella tabrizica]